jgi:hypothetical protein
MFICNGHCLVTHIVLLTHQAKVFELLYSCQVVFSKSRQLATKQRLMATIKRILLTDH